LAPPTAHPAARPTRRCSVCPPKDPDDAGRVPDPTAFGCDLLSIELVGDLADGQATSVQPADAAGDFPLGLVGDELLAFGGEPVTDPAAGEPASLGLEPAAAA
jgi:hypothetical protein